MYPEKKAGAAVLKKKAAWKIQAAKVHQALTVLYILYA